MYILNIIPYQNYVNHIQYHPGQEATGTDSKLTIDSKKKQKTIKLETNLNFHFFLVK